MKLKLGNRQVLHTVALPPPGGALPEALSPWGWDSVPRGGRYRVAASQTSPKVTRCIPHNSCPAFLYDPRVGCPSLLCLKYTQHTVLAPHKVLPEQGALLQRKVPRVRTEPCPHCVLSLLRGWEARNHEPSFLCYVHF